MALIGLLVRAITYSTLFIGVLLVYLPGRTLSRAGITAPLGFGPTQIIGAAVTVAGAMLAVWCIVTFVFAGRGTPAPFDPPRRLVSCGPYEHVRNPMYLGAGAALAGAALFYSSGALVVYAAAFLLLTHLFVVAYEEPTLRQTFGTEYDAYCARVRRWTPTFST